MIMNEINFVIAVFSLDLHYSVPVHFHFAHYDNISIYFCMVYIYLYDYFHEMDYDIW